MDSNTFAYVTLASALGGVLGNVVGYKRLVRERDLDLKRAQIDGNELAVNPETRDFVTKVSDVGRVVGSMAMSGLYGNLVYPLIPPFILPFVIKRDLSK